MLNETFYLDGIDARSAGIQLQAPIEFSEAVPVVEAATAIAILDAITER